MGMVYLGTDLAGLAQKLGERLDRQFRDGDFFLPATIVVPNATVRRWLELWLAKNHSIAINLRFAFLESILFEMLRAVDPRSHDHEPELLDAQTYQLMVLSVLWESRHPDLESLRRYCRIDEGTSRQGCRRAWHLSQRFGTAIRDYEYHRQNELIQHWLKGKTALNDPSSANFERGQMAIFRGIVDAKSGKRAILGQALGKNFKTLPQYAMEVMELKETRKPAISTVHLFGVSQMSALHLQTLQWLSRNIDWQVYHLNPFAGGLVSMPSADDVERLLPLFRGGKQETQESAHELLRQWGRGGIESLGILAKMLGEVYPMENLDPRAVEDPAGMNPAASKKPSVLARLQESLLGRTLPADPLPQDSSLQIGRCPGVTREVETLYQSILDNLLRQPELRQTDIGVLVTDMSVYRPALVGVFERRPKHLHYNLADYPAARLSMFGQALTGMFELALESLTRSRVTGLLLNPCFLARLGVDRDQAQTFIRWIDRLGIYHGWDAQDKSEQGYAGSPWFSWKLGLRRLRLGRYMEAAETGANGAVPHFGDVIPYADLESVDRDLLDAFSRAVEGLLPTLLGLRKKRGDAAFWAKEMRYLIGRFLDVPADRPEEVPVRDQVLRALDRLEDCDALFPRAAAEALPLPLIREYLHSSLEGIAAKVGEPLTGGVTIAALSAMRPIPFEIVYVLGLGEEHFPGSDRLPTFDLRRADRKLGDIRPAEQNRFALLEALVAARRKVYLLYNGRDIQKDKPRLPCAPLKQLERFLSAKIVDRPFFEVEVPLAPNSPAYLKPQAEWQDVLVQYDETARLLALADAQGAGSIRLSSQRIGELSRLVQKHRPDFSLAAGRQEAPARSTNVTIRQLWDFLRCPAKSFLLRHLNLAEEKDEELEEDEPFSCSWWTQQELFKKVLREIVIQAAQGHLDKALAAWPAQLQAFYQDCQRRSQAPEDAFGQIDCRALEEKWRGIIDREGGLADFLRARGGRTFCGPILLGDSLTPVGPRRRFPALAWVDRERQIRLSGSMPLAWHDERVFEILAWTHKDRDYFRKGHLSLPLVEPFLFYFALLANDAPGSDGISSRRWLKGRRLDLHLAGPDHLTTFSLPSGKVAPAGAHDYLRQLTADMLDGASFDLLPFDLIVAEEELRLAYQSADGVEASDAEAYRQAILDAVEEDEESDFGRKYRPGDLVRASRPEVPSDASVKVRRRYRLLDLGPSLAREHMEAAKSHGKRKGNRRKKAND